MAELTKEQQMQYHSVTTAALKNLTTVIDQLASLDNPRLDAVIDSLETSREELETAAKEYE